MSKALATSPVRPRGRPRRLSLDAIVDAGCEIGLDRIDMALVADRLGTGVATLYNYVDGKGQLVRLMLDRLSQQGQVVDRGQDWQDVLRDHAEAVFEANRAWPQLIDHLVAGELGGCDQAQYLHSFLTVLARRGIAADRGVALFYEINQLAIGAAVGARHRAAREEAALADPIGAGAGVVGAPADAGVPAVLGDYRPTLELVLQRENKMMEEDDGRHGLHG